MLTDSTRNADFPSLKSRAYLNTAAEGIPPRPVIEALGQYAQDKLLGMDGRKLHEAQWRGALAEVARAYGLTDQDVGICSCSSEATERSACGGRRRGEGGLGAWRATRRPDSRETSPRGLTRSQGL